MEPKLKFAIALGAVGILATVITGVILITRSARYYPDYRPMHYSLLTTMKENLFLEGSDYNHGPNPTKGLVRYVDGADVASHNLTYAGSSLNTCSSSAVIRVDATGQLASSVPLWGPSFVASSTPRTGVADGLLFGSLIRLSGQWMRKLNILEAANTALTGNQMTLHTSQGCTWT
ncbi:hypothetical protein IFM5058_09994 [Aspergillus udagawae]|nr:hypothetical protein IFM5058_09994 [Aspergillus udagawae]